MQGGADKVGGLRIVSTVNVVLIYSTSKVEAEEAKSHVQVPLTLLGLAAPSGTQPYEARKILKSNSNSLPLSFGGKS